MACSCRPLSPSRCCSADWPHTPPTLLPQRPDFLPERDGRLVLIGLKRGDDLVLNPPGMPQGKTPLKSDAIEAGDRLIVISYDLPGPKLFNRQVAAATA